MVTVYYLTWGKNMSEKEIDDQANIRRLRCLKCAGLGYITKKQTHPRQGLIEVREQCDCLSSTLPIPEIKDGRLSFKLKGENAD